MKRVKKILSIVLSITMLLSITTSIDLSVYANTSGDFEYSVSGSKATITGYTGSSTSVTIPSKIGSYTVTSIGDFAFHNCKSLTSVTIPNSVTSIRYKAFDYCTSLTNVTIPNSVTSIGNDAFDECNKLNKVNISSIESWCKISFSYYSSNPLYYANNLYLNDELVTDLIISNSVTSIGKYAFGNCKSLTSVTIPNSVTSIGIQAFSGCTSLTSVTIPNSVTTIGSDAFYRVNNIVYNGSASGSPWGAKSVNGYVDGYLVYKDSAKKKLLGCSAQATSVTIPNSVTSIGSSAFESCTSLTSVTIPNSVTSIGNDAFYYCTSLSSVTIPNSVTSIGDRAFFYCTSLTSITIPNSIKSIGEYAFCLVNNIEYHGSASGSPWGAKSVNGYVDGYLVYRNSTKKELLGCSSQPTSVTIPNSVTIIGGSAFEYCTSLTSVTIPNSVTNIGGYAFWNCKSLTSVTIPNSVTNIGGYAFRNCTSLTSVTIGDSVTSIGDRAFFYCTSLTSVTIPNSVTSIGSDAFGNCTSLTSVTIGDSVTSIGSYAFSDCTSLTSVTIGDSVTSIGSYAFSNCSKLKYVFYSGTQSEWQSIDIGEDNTDLTSAKKHYNSTGDHSWNSGAVTKQPTCVGTGIKTYTCTVCDETKEDTINATGVHTWDSGTVTKQPTCIGTGVKTYSCTNCTASKTEVINVASHNYTSKITQEATCTEKGVRTYTCTVCNDSYTETITATGHNYTSKITQEVTCTENGVRTYTCTGCNDSYTETITATGHSNRVKVSKATTTKNGSVVSECSKCGKSTTQVIYYPKTISLSATSYTYDGKVKTPSVKVVGSNGKAISSSNYTVSYASGRKNVGKYAVKITFKGNYSGTKTLYFTINPKGTSISKITAAKKGFKVYWKKQSTQTTGYQIQYSTSSKFSNAKTVTLTKNSYTSKSISKLSAKKKYYVHVRTYKKIGSTYYYSSWSKAKYVTTK